MPPSVFHTADEVVRDLPDRPPVQRDVRRGQAIVERGVPALGRAAGRAYEGLSRAYERVSAPWAEAAPLRALGRAFAHPGVVRNLALLTSLGTVGYAALRGSTAMRAGGAPGGYETKQYPWGADNALSLARQGIEITASENDTMNVADLFKSAGILDFMRSIGTGMTSASTGESVGSNLMGGAIRGLGLLGVTGLTYGGGKLYEMLRTEPARQRLLEEVIKTDPIVSDAVKRDPRMRVQLEQAYASIVRFAPSVSLDINMVRSILREVSVTGGGLGYATIKMLAETEKEINFRHGKEK